jgi:LuxR family maltose regulon positive regulatory protein
MHQPDHGSTSVTPEREPGCVISREAMSEQGCLPVIVETVPSEFHTKIHAPAASGHTIRRQRLIDLLHRDLHLGLQLVAAPAGYGKTTLLADFCSDLDIPVCWYAIDRADADPDCFLRGILASVRLHFPEFGRSTVARLAASERAAPTGAQLAEALVRDMSEGIPDYFLLVLEDCHQSEGSPVFMDLLDSLIARMPENCHLIISSRTAIEVPVLTTRMVRGQASSLTASDLAFSAGEIKELVTRDKGPALSDAAIDKLAQDTEGWIVGLMLHLREVRPDRQLEGFPTLTREDLFRYLTAEAYAQLPAAIREFLLKSSVLEPIEPDFCDRLLGIDRSLRLLKAAQRQNLFVSCVDLKPLCYRYHPLFRDFLQEKLAEDNPRESSRLHVRAAVMFRKEHRWQDAIEHFIAAKRYAQATDVIRQVGQYLLKSGKWLTISSWIDSLPPRFRLGDGELLLLRAQADVHIGRLDEAARALTQVIAGTTGPDSWLRRARALSWRSAAHRLAGHLPDARADIKGAIALLEQNGGPADSLGDAYRRLGIIHLEEGRLAASLPHLKRALKHYSSVFDIAETAAVHNALGTAYRELGNLVKASAHFDFARQSWQKVGNAGALASLLNNLGLLYQSQGDYDRALKTLRTGLENARASGYRRMEACVMISIADVLRDICLFDEALTMYEEGLAVAESVMEVYYVTWATAGMGETYRLLGAPQKAETLLKQALSQAEVHGRPYESALFSVRLGIMEYEGGEYQKALATLRQVLGFLKQVGDKEALARTHFHLAQAMFLSKDYGGAELALADASRLAGELGYDSFLTVEGRNATLLLQFAGSRGIGAGHYVRLLEQVRSRQAPQLTAPDRFKVDRLVRSRPEFEVFAFGEGRVLINNQMVRDSDWRSGRAREMFFYLLNAEAPRSKEQIAAALWPDLSPARSTSNFHISIHRARHALFPGIISLQEGLYRIPPDLAIWSDVTEFSDILLRVDETRTDPDGRADLLQKAIELYSGPFLPDIYSDWAETRRRELESRYLKALTALARSCAARGDLDRALRLLENVAAIDPYHDELSLAIEQYARSHAYPPLQIQDFLRSLARLRARNEDDPQTRRLPGPGSSRDPIARR